MSELVATLDRETGELIEDSGDGGNLEAISQRIADLYQEGDRKRFLIGALLSRADRRYGSGLVSEISKNTGISRSALYDYLKVERFYRGRQLSAARIIREYPNLFFSHLRTAMRYGDPGIARIELTAASDFGLSADKFRVEVAKQLGKNIPPEPIFDETGNFFDVIRRLEKLLATTQIKGLQRVRVIVRPEE